MGAGQFSAPRDLGDHVTSYCLGSHKIHLITNFILVDFALTSSSTVFPQVPPDRKYVSQHAPVRISIPHDRLLPTYI